MKRIFAAFLLFSVLASASHLSDLMDRYKRAPESQRYKIMNQIKLEIARLHKKRQRAAISKLRHVVATTSGKAAKKKIKRKNSVHSNTHSRYSAHSSHVQRAHSAAHSVHNSVHDTAHRVHESVHDSISNAMDTITGGDSFGKSGSSSHSGSSHSGSSSSGGGFGPSGGFSPGGF